MKRIILISLIACSYLPHSFATNLLTVYQDALKNDPLYHQALAQQLSSAQGAPITLANLLPNAGISFTPFVSKTTASGSAISFTTLPDGSSTTGSSSIRGYSAALNISQPVIDFMQINKYLMAKESAKQAQALINSAGQDLMVRVAKAYFSVAADQENLRNARIIKKAFYDQYMRVQHQYKSGYKSVIDVHTAHASYEKSRADYITIQIMLNADKEKLHLITNRYYSDLSVIKRLPIIKPNPSNVDKWIEIAERQNWDIKAAQYAKTAALKNINQQWAGHLPSVYVQGGYNVSFNRNMGDAASPSTGSSKYNTTSANLSVNVPIFSGGGVIAQTEKAKYDYQVSAEKLDKQFLDTIDLAKESYFGLTARTDRIQTDIILIKATRQSLAGMEEKYIAGTENLVNVLNQRENLFSAQKEHTNDRYLYIINYMTLKQAAGTLCPEDLLMINSWLSN